jgi:hypothetical protein
MKKIIVPFVIILLASWIVQAICFLKITALEKRFFALSTLEKRISALEEKATLRVLPVE